MHANFYSGNPIDRVSAQRDDPAAIAAWRNSPDSLILPVWRDRHLVRDGGRDGGSIRIGMPSAAELGDHGAGLDAHPWVLLGTMSGRALLAFDISGADDPSTLIAPSHGRFESLRPLVALLPGEEAAILAQTRGMLYWRRHHRFCGRCGGPTEPEQGGTRLACPQCKLQHFPRTDPVAIMLVHHQGRALLARGTRFPGRRLFSALAGFIEPGESAEEAVAREVREETGIEVGRITYHSSQPWPYPNSLMLGFHAEAVDVPHLVLDPGEIAEAHWLTPDQVRAPETLDIELPGPTAIARSLIDAWLAGL